MRHKETIEKLMNEILSEEIDLLNLKKSLEDFKQLLLDLTQLDLEKQSNKEDIQFENGVALCLTFAAMCIDDLIRTRQFIRGVFNAVKDVRSQKNKPVRILYAGTGPFAALVLPLLTKFNADELQLTLLEVNQETCKYLKRLIEELKIENYIEKILCEDASKYEIDKNLKVDILISETMQHGLVREQQVPIMLNLVNQLDKDVIVIPSKIQLDLALMNSSTDLLLKGSPQSKYRIVKTLLEFDKSFMYSFADKNMLTKRFELCKQLQFLKEEEEMYDKLVILTSIQVYKEDWINFDASGLTIPKILFDLQRVIADKKQISLDYVISKNPDFEYELN